MEAVDLRHQRIEHVEELAARLVTRHRRDGGRDGFGDSSSSTTSEATLPRWPSGGTCSSRSRSACVMAPSLAPSTPTPRNAFPRAPCNIRRIRLTIFDATSSGDSCSQYLRTVHPLLFNAWPVSRSRRTIRANLVCQYVRFVLGEVACSGQPCQKQPSMNTATRARVKTISARVRRSGFNLWSTR